MSTKFLGTPFYSYQIPLYHERCIWNPSNYKSWYDEETNATYYQFFITEEDYEYAKENGVIK